MHGSNEFYKLGLKIGRAGNPTKTIYNQLPKDLEVCKVIAGMNNSVIIFNSTSWSSEKTRVWGFFSDLTSHPTQL